MRPDLRDGIPDLDRPLRLVAVHAHPDDETLATGLTLAHHSAAGDEVHVITCTLGEEGEVITPELAHLEGTEELGVHRRTEIAAATAALGVRHHWLGGDPPRWRDSGMAGSAAARHPRAFAAADVDFHDELPRLFPAKPDARDLFGDETAREATARAGGMLQAGYWIVGLRAAGLAVGPMGGFDADAVERDFFPDGRHRALLVVNVGHPAADAYYPRAPRLDVDEVVTVA